LTSLPNQNFHQVAASESQKQMRQMLSTQSQSPADFSRAVQHTPVHELGDDLPSFERPYRQREMPFETRSPDPRQAVPLNPDYSTLEYVVTLDARSRPPASLTSTSRYQQYMRPLDQQSQRSLSNDHGYEKEWLPDQPSSTQTGSGSQTGRMGTVSIANGPPQRVCIVACGGEYHTS
jgi:hypothetical protein